MTHGSWHVELLDLRVEKELDALAADVRQRFLRIAELIERHGPAAVHEPYVKHLEGKLWEMRMKGRDGVARAIYLTAKGERVAFSVLCNNHNLSNKKAIETIDQIVEKIVADGN